MLEIAEDILGLNLENILLENWFILSVGIFWLIIASIQDLKRREVENWWSFSLIVFVLAFRAFLSVEKGNYMYFVWALAGLVIGFLLMNLFYYARMFAGGDAKLLMAIFCVLPLSLDWKINLLISTIFIFGFVFLGAVYGLIYSLILMVFNFKKFKKEFFYIFKKYKNAILYFEAVILILVIILWIFSLELLFYLFLLILIYPFLVMYAKAVEKSCMDRFVNVEDLTIGDWLSKPITVHGKMIKPYWEGISEEQLQDIKKYYKKKVLVKYGIPFVPAFLLGFLALILLLWGA